MSSMKEKMHTGELYLPGDEEITERQIKCLDMLYDIVDDTHIYVGDNTMFGPKVTVAVAGHPILPELREQVYQYNMPVHIGRNCWIGANAVILPGITIGDNVVVGAGSVVTKDLPDNVVAVGNPCRILREINEHDREYYFKDRKIPEELR